MTKKRSSEILADEKGTFFREKVKFLKFSESQKIFENRGKSETGGNASWPQGGWTPLASNITSSAATPGILHLSLLSPAA